MARPTRRGTAPTKAAGPITPAEAARRLLELRSASENFLSFVRFMNPTWDLGAFQIELIETLDQLEKGTLKNAEGKPVNNLLVTMPPRFAKSTFATILFPTYFMARDPSRYTMTCSYNDKLATDFGRQVRNLAEDPRLQQLFPKFGPSKDSRAVDVWRTEENGAYYAIGVGGTTSGRPANLLVLDDPIKAREEAESMTQRNKSWNYYASALSTRLQPDNYGNPPKQIVVLTRWHPDDIAGRLQRSEDWKEGHWAHINFPAIRTIKTRAIARSALPHDHPQYIPDVSKVTQSQRIFQEEQEVSLWPERFPLPDLLRRRRLNPREFASLYQQTPYIEGGNLIKSEWWQYTPSDIRPERFAAVVITMDTAFKKTEQSDYSVAVTAGIDHGGDMHILDVMRGRYDFPELKQRAMSLNAKWRGKGLRGLYIEDKASGQSLIQELKRQSGMSIIPYKVGHDKVSRLNAVLPLIEGGRVFLPEEAPWLDEFMEECMSFPGGTHDDQVDAFAMALEVLSRTHVTPEAYELSSNLDLALNRQDGRALNAMGKSLRSTLADKLYTSLSPWKGWGT